MIYSFSTFYVKRKKREEWDSFSFFAEFLCPEKISNAVQILKETCAVYGDGAIAERAIPMWFAIIRNEHFDL